MTANNPLESKTPDGCSWEMSFCPNRVLHLAVGEYLRERLEQEQADDEQPWQALGFSSVDDYQASIDSDALYELYWYRTPVSHILVRSSSLARLMLAYDDNTRDASL